MYHRCVYLTLTGVFLATLAVASHAQQVPIQPEFRAALVRVQDVTAVKLDEFKRDGFNALVLMLDSNATSGKSGVRVAAEQIKNAELDLWYWIEVARCPELADAEPQWMASLQTHGEWRRFFPSAPQPAVDEVAKTYPWVPILSREPFAAQLKRVRQLLNDAPPPDGVLLNDLQGAPSACGCGNTLCRWTSDYGKRRTTVPLGDDAATLFVDAVRKTLPESEVIPVWTTECEKHDGAKDGQCAGVGCYDGICWKAYTRQLMPLQARSKRIGVLTPYKDFHRDVPFYDGEAGWIRHAIASFATQPAQHGGKSIPASRLIAVLQGWDVTLAEIKAQMENAEQAGVGGLVVAYAKIEQGWQPKIAKWK